MMLSRTTPYAGMPHHLEAMLEFMADFDDHALLDAFWDAYKANYLAVWRSRYRNGYYNRRTDLHTSTAAVAVIKGNFGKLIELMTETAAVVCPCDVARYSDDSDLTEIDDKFFCDDCLHDHYQTCSDCENLRSVDDIVYINDEPVCETCRDDNYTYCDECCQYFPDSDDHRHGCDCEAPHLHFTFPANGDGTVTENERITVALPKGLISDEGIQAIKNVLYNREYNTWMEDPDRTRATRPNAGVIFAVVDELGVEWQGKRGNFTKRLSSAWYKKFKTKLDGDLISEIGNLARAHSSSASELHIEFTRDLNGRASEFAHSGSCWWESYFESRCAFKNWGGIGMRSYMDMEEYRENPSGRVWVQPLNEELQPTHQTHAFAYIVYNGYGDLSGYISARIVGHLTGKTYKKISFGADPQYVNNGGYLVADEVTCADTDEIDYSYSTHDQLDAKTLIKTGAAA